MKTKREEAVGKAHKRAEEEKERKAAGKREQEKLALREQMKVSPKIKLVRQSQIVQSVMQDCQYDVSHLLL